MPSTVRNTSASTFGRAIDCHEVIVPDGRSENATLPSPALGVVGSGDEADTDGEHEIQNTTARGTTINFRDFENEKCGSGSKSPKMRFKEKSKNKTHHRKHKTLPAEHAQIEKSPSKPMPDNQLANHRQATPHISSVQETHQASESSPKRPFNIRGLTGLTVRDVVPSAMPKMLASTVFSTAQTIHVQPGSATATGITPRALHRSSSLPSRLNQNSRQAQAVPPIQLQPNDLPANAVLTGDDKMTIQTKKHMSRVSAIILLLISTGLVAVCAEFLVSSIGYLVSHTSVSQAFVGLILLPIVGNAAEHVTAVTVASKNKMDLAIGVAVGSSIQIALFVTPVIVLLGWILNKDMSLYFSLFETVSLFVSAFIVNFLVLDGRSNYLEGALLIAAYVIIALAAFFYPDSDEQSVVGGAAESTRTMLLRMF